MDNTLFTATSPLGYTVICDKAQWDGHVVKNHPIMNGKEQTVKNAIENPLIVYPSDEQPDRDVYFGEFGNNNQKVLFTKVIVGKMDKDAEVITAFPQKDISGNINAGVIKYVKTKL